MSTKRAREAGRESSTVPAGSETGGTCSTCSPVPGDLASRGTPPGAPASAAGTTGTVFPATDRLLSIIVMGKNTKGQ